MTDHTELLRELELSFSETSLTPAEKQAHIDRLVRDADLAVTADPDTPPLTRQP
ncbi:hypothetical protein QCN27_15920 [Cereibacter sp. SYSU M97828]|nr:hypothetical protein [Cereibacter flavus]